MKKNIFVSLKNDYAFTQVMKQPKVIKGFLSSILHIQPERIGNIHIKDRHLPKDLPEDKLSILDLYTIVEDIGRSTSKCKCYPMHFGTEEYSPICQKFIHKI